MLLVYTLATPQNDKPAFDVVKNGDEFVFLKLVASEAPLYIMCQELFRCLGGTVKSKEVLRIMKQ